MTYFPDYLKTYPNMHSAFPLHLSKNTLEHGFRAHRHDFLEFSYVIEGTGSESVNDVKHDMKTGTFTFVLPYQVHEIFTDPGQKLVLYNCMFPMDMLMESGNDPGLSGLLNDITSLPAYVQLSGGDQQLMLALLEEMYQEYSGSERYRQTLLKSRLKEILIRFDRHRWKQAGPMEEAEAQAARELQPQSGAKTSHAVWPIIHYIHRNYQEELALSDLASRFSMSISRISEVIKQTTGQTFVHFLHDLRLRHACSLLVSTDMSVTEIAHEVGYGSYKTFSRIFRESKGIVPKDYRKMVGEGRK
ncbi:AraC family transcriptional regulator [Bacillus sp. 3255]|uniref:AraC family transcriptional regulator n=1 Tax=Bacillus sp. 3255 TaxID=2817904 RepID=UPI002865ACED|nr:AraC family transcriptional regulator [Bacillus sp. 3255]MDR6881203.1 AraC-like DNA-binding protein [Bacillus sp. 3255]